MTTEQRIAKLKPLLQSAFNALSCSDIISILTKCTIWSLFANPVTNALSIMTLGEPFRESCRRLLLLLDECFSEVQQWLPGARPQLAFSCLECTRDAQPDILSRAKFCPFTLQQSVSYPLRCLIGHLTTLSDNHKLWLQIDALLPNSEFHTIFEV